jgi:hypothetical protein
MRKRYPDQANVASRSSAVADTVLAVASSTEHGSIVRVDRRL